MGAKKQQTAVDYLLKEFSAILGPVSTTSMQDLLMVDAVKKAKEMEKEQIVEAWNNAAIDASYGNKYKSFEQYYNGTYETN